MSQDVREILIRPGREFLWSKGSRSALSLRDTKHRTIHSLNGEGIWAWPVLEGPFESLEEWQAAERPLDKGLDVDQVWMSEEWSPFAVPKVEPPPAPDKPYFEMTDEELALYANDPMDPARLHSEVILPHRISCWQHNALDVAGKNPQGDQDQYRHPVNWAAAFGVAVCVVGMVIMAVITAAKGGI